MFLGQGNGTFQSPLSYSAGINPTFITTADVNGDNALDLLVATRAPNFVYDIAVLLGNGNGTFQPATLFTTDYGPAAVSPGAVLATGLAVSFSCNRGKCRFADRRNCSLQYPHHLIRLLT